MLPSFRMQPRLQRRRLLGITLLVVGLFSFQNVSRLSLHPHTRRVEPHPTLIQLDTHVLPPELVEFVQNGGFDDSERIIVESRPVESTLVESETPGATAIEPANLNKRPASSSLLLQNTNDTNRAPTHPPPQHKDHHKKKQRYHAKKKKNRVITHDGFPPLDRLVHNDKITGSVDWLLDFAILGHAKCATTYVMNWLRQHPAVQMHDREVCDLNDRQPAALVQNLYKDLEPGQEYVRGFKCPGHFSREPLRYFRQYFGQTKLIVGLRHPVRWFESYYNFRIRHPRGGPMPPPEKLLGKCVHESQGVCTDRANFHRNLAMLGKTNHSEPIQRALLVGLPAKYQAGLSEIANPVFLYDVGQLYDRNAERKAQFQADLEDFVGLDTPLQANYTEPSSSKSDAGLKFTKLDICHAEFDDIRRELVTIARRAAIWITTYFMQSESVVVSSPEYFREILQTWHTDPCIKSTS